MANEKLVSSVYFRGTVNGVASLDIIDTSVPPNYTVTYDNRGHQINDPTKALDLKPGRDLVIELQQVPVNELVSKVYVRLTGAQAANFTMSNVMGMTDIGNGGKTGTVNISPSGYGKVNAILTNYPSYSPSDANIDFFHDEALTQKFLTVPLVARPVVRPRLTITTLRESPRATTGVYNNDTLVVLYEDDTNQSNFYLTVLPYKLFVDNVEIAQDVYPETGVNYFKGTVSTLLGNFGMGSKGASTNVRQKNLVSPGNKTIKVTMGSIEATAPLLDSDSGVVLGRSVHLLGGTGLKPVTDPLPGNITTTTDPNMAMAFAFQRYNYVPPASINDTPNYPRDPVTSFMESMVAMRFVASPKALAITGTGQITNQQSGQPEVAYSLGRLNTFIWDPRSLTTAKSREQFGKYQNSFSTLFKWVAETQQGVSYTYPKYQSGQASITVNDLNNPVATAQYGALTNISFSTLACFAFNTRDSSIQGLEFETTAILAAFNGDWSKLTPSVFKHGTVSATPALPPEIPSNPTDRGVRCDSLFIRVNTPNELNTFSPDCPYPRFINVQNAKGYEAYKGTANYGTFWDFRINANLGIDMRNPRYAFVTTVQQDSSWGWELASPQQVAMHALSPTRAMFRSGWTTVDPTLSIALVDLGPDTPPVNDTFKFKNVRLPPDGSFVENVGAGNYMNMDYGAENILVEKGRVGNNYVKFKNIINKMTNKTNPEQGSLSCQISLEFFTDSSYNTPDNTSAKPNFVYASFRGLTYRLTRWSFDPANRNYQFYTIIGPDATHNVLINWMNAMAASVDNPTDLYLVFG